MKAAFVGALAGSALAVLPPLPQVSEQFVLNVPRKGEDIPRITNLVLVSDKGHSETMTKGNICSQIDGAFNAGNYAAQCRVDIATTVRHARGLALQHDDGYAQAVQEFQTKLSEQGYYAREYEAPTLYQRPFKANFMQRLMRGETDGKPAVTFCETGFGAGHSAMMALRSSPAVKVYSFDHGLARHTVPAHDLLDEKFPDRLFLFLGDSAVTVNSLTGYYPGTTCDVIYVDGSFTYNGTKSDLEAFRALASPDHVLVLANAALHSEAMKAWSEAEAAGSLSWEGTLLESVDRPAGDALVYGKFAPVQSQQVPAQP